MTNPNPNARRNIKPGLSVPAGLDPELEKFLRAVKEHLQGNDGTKGQPLERFVTLDDLKRIGLIDTMVKGGRGEIKTLRAGTGTDLTSAAVTSLANLSDTSVGGSQNGHVLRWNALLGKWRTGPLLDSDGVVLVDYIPVTDLQLELEVFTATVPGFVPAPGSVTGAFLRDDGTFAAVSGATDVTPATTWTADDESALFPDGRMVIEGVNIEFDYTVDNEITIDILPVHQKGAGWSNKSGTAIVTADAVEVTISIPWNCIIREVVVTTFGGTGSCVIDIEKSTYSGFPTTASITASAKPTITSGTKYSDATLTGWTTVLSAGDVLRFQLESSTVFSQISVVLKLKETN